MTYLRREVYRNVGACLSPHNAYLQTLGLETLELRMNKSCDNALRIAQWLQRSPKVKYVNYPGLEDSPHYAAACAQFSGAFGNVLTFRLKDREACFTLINNFKIIRRATNLHDNKTLVIHPGSTIFCDYSPEDKAEMAVSDDMLRLSLGIEDPDDIIDDLSAAFDRL